MADNGGAVSCCFVVVGAYLMAMRHGSRGTDPRWWLWGHRGCEGGTVASCERLAGSGTLNSMTLECFRKVPRQSRSQPVVDLFTFEVVINPVSLNGMAFIDWV